MWDVVHQGDCRVARGSGTGGRGKHWLVLKRFNAAQQLTDVDQVVHRTQSHITDHSNESVHELSHQ
jgi:hypothetical protein